MRQEFIPSPHSDVAKALFDVAVEFVGPSALTFGGGTVLASRWGHRKSFDVDLFCDPGEYALLSRRCRTLIEKGIVQIDGCDSEQTWCEDIATYTKINGVTATMLPRSVALRPDQPSRLAGTELRIQSSAQILYGKIVGRMYGEGKVAVRDAYDIACARIHDPGELAQACDHASPRVLSTVEEVVEMLPSGWSHGDTEGLVEPRHRWSESTLRENLIAGLRGEPRAIRRAETRGR